jgi:hypothetical protein
LKQRSPESKKPSIHEFESSTRVSILEEINKVAVDFRPMGRVIKTEKSPNMTKE